MEDLPNWMENVLTFIIRRNPVMESRPHFLKGRASNDTYPDREMDRGRSAENFHSS